MAKSSRQAHRRMMLINKILIIFAFVMIIVLFAMWYLQPKPTYYAVNSRGGKMYSQQIISIDHPINNRQAIMQWAQRAATAAFSFDANNFREKLTSVAKRYFTPSGGEEFLNAMLESGETKLVVTQQLIVTSVVNDTPVLLEEGPLNGHHTWKIQIPLLVTYQSASEVTQQYLLITVFIRRVSTRMNPQGIAINQFLASKR